MNEYDALFSVDAIVGLFENSFKRLRTYDPQPFNYATRIKNNVRFFPSRTTRFFFSLCVTIILNIK